jgi:DNA repair protein RadC
MTMEAQTLIDCVERIREHLLREDATLGERLAGLRVADHRSADAGLMAAKSVAVAAGIDDSTPAGRRDVQMTMVGMVGIAEGNGTVAEPGAALASRAGASRKRSRAPLGLSVQEVELRARSLRDGLAATAALAEAVACVRKVYPGLTGTRAHEFLAAIGYPAPVPSVAQVRFAGRLGIVDGDVSATLAQDQYVQRVQFVGGETGEGTLAVDHLLALFSGARLSRGLEPVCGARPRCAICPVSALCEYFAKQETPKPGDGGNGATADKHLSIKEWAAPERPRERLLAGENLSDSELVAILLRTGSRGKSAVDVARRLLADHCDNDLRRLAEKSPHQLKEVSGLGEARAATICAAIELGRRVAKGELDRRTHLPVFLNSAAVFEHFRSRFMHARQEKFLLLTLNTKNCMTREVEISSGSLNASIVHPREVFREAIMESSAGVIVLHNHPSGDPTPSAEDRALTKRLVDAGKLLGVKVQDHVIIGATSWYSFADSGWPT